MRKFSMMFVLGVLASMPAAAQFNRTAVSISGLDTNSCAVSSPCRTFSRAISQTNAHGEVIALTSGGYGAFDIDRAISIIAPAGVYAGIAVVGNFKTAVNVNAPSDAHVILRGLSFQDLNAVVGIGLSVNSAASIVIDRVTMDGFGTNFCIGTGVNTLVEDSTFRRCSEGVRVDSAVGGVLVNRCAFYDSQGHAVSSGTNASVVVRNSVSHRSLNYGFAASAASLQTNIENSEATGSGIYGFGAFGAVVRLSNCVATDNNAGFGSNPSATLESYGNNKSRGNSVDVNGSLAVVAQQ